MDDRPELVPQPITRTVYVGAFDDEGEPVSEVHEGADASVRDGHLYVTSGLEVTVYAPTHWARVRSVPHYDA